MGHLGGIRARAYRTGLEAPSPRSGSVRRDFRDSPKDVVAETTAIRSCRWAADKVSASGHLVYAGPEWAVSRNLQSTGIGPITVLGRGLFFAGFLQPGMSWMYFDFMDDRD